MSWTAQQLEEVCRTLVPKYDAWAGAGAYTFDHAAALKVVAFFEECLCFTNAKWLGTPFILQSWQAAIIGNLFGWKRADGTRRYRKCLIFTGMKAGKALALTTPIATPAGWTTMGELHVGDQVFDENGIPCNVTFTTEAMHGHECYTVTFSDGDTIIADAEHLWAVQTRRPAKLQTLTTRQLADTLHIQSYRYCNHSIFVAGALQLPPAALPIDPYVLGVWLGNGTTKCASITFNEDDPAVMQQVEAAGYHVDAPNNRGGKGITCWIGKGKARGGTAEIPFQVKLRRLGMLGNKHIPLQYLRASVSQRLRLLQGLMDTDGTISKLGRCEFCVTNRLLADDTLHLIRSLGIKAALTVCNALLNGRIVGLRYRIHFTAFSDMPVFSLARKLARMKERPARLTRAGTKQIVSIVPAESVPVRCIQVDAPSHLYLAGKSFTPTHNTELAAGIGNALLFIDGEPSPEIVTAAGNADQATKIFNAASTMVTQEPELSRRSTVFQRSIECTTNRGIMKVINAAAKTKFGGNLHAALIDELHVHPDGDLVDVLERSMRARRQPLMLYTTTAGDDPESIAGEVYDYACKVRDGIIEDTEFLPIIFECPREADIADPANWKLAQPNLGVTVPVSEYERDYREALAVPRKMQKFRQLQLNQWTESAVSWIGLDEWKKCGGTVDPAKLKGKRATLGIDLSSTTDTTAVVAVIEDAGKLHVLPSIFIPRDNAEGRFRRQKRDRAPYLSWIEQGFITATEGNTIDYEIVEAKIIELSKLFDLVEVQSDPYNASGLLERLIKAGLPVTTVRQGWSLAEATKEAERLILSGELVHPENPAFTWQVSNAAVKQDARENCWLDKQKSTRRIDAAVAMIMGINAMRFGKGRESAGAERPYYEKHPELIML